MSQLFLLTPYAALHKLYHPNFFAARLSGYDYSLAVHCGLEIPIAYPQQLGLRTGADMLPYLITGLGLLKMNPEKYLNVAYPDGTRPDGEYRAFVTFVTDYYLACAYHPEGIIKVLGHRKIPESLLHP